MKTNVFMCFFFDIPRIKRFHLKRKGFALKIKMKNSDKDNIKMTNDNNGNKIKHNLVLTIL